MKLTEEQDAWIDSAVQDLPVNPHSPYVAGWKDGAEMALMKFGGIQWNKYPEAQPTLGTYVDIITASNHRIADCEAEADGFYHREDDRFYDHTSVTHWAEINLPNDEQ